MFKIALHQDDADVLLYIQRRLAIGNVRHYKNECIFNVTDRKGVELLISIFDKYNLNTTKYLDYLDFKEAFKLYHNRDKDLKVEWIKDAIIELKNKMNTNRVNFDRPENSNIVVTKWWLLGFVEGDGSFFMRRDTFTPVFSIELGGVNLDILVKIKEFLEKSLGFNLYSLYKLKNSSIIAVTTVKARSNRKSSVAITSEIYRSCSWSLSMKKERTKLVSLNTRWLDGTVARTKEVKSWDRRRVMVDLAPRHRGRCPGL